MSDDFLGSDPENRAFLHRVILVAAIVEGVVILAAILTQLDLLPF